MSCSSQSCMQKRILVYLLPNGSSRVNRMWVGGSCSWVSSLITLNQHFSGLSIMEHNNSHVTCGTATYTVFDRSTVCNRVQENATFKEDALWATKCHLMQIRMIIFSQGRQLFFFFFNVSCWKHIIIGHMLWNFQVLAKKESAQQVFYIEHSSNEVWIATCCNLIQILTLCVACCTAPMRCHALSISRNHEKEFTITWIYLLVVSIVNFGVSLAICSIFKLDLITDTSESNSDINVRIKKHTLHYRLLCHWHCKSRTLFFWPFI